MSEVKNGAETDEEKVGFNLFFEHKPNTKIKKRILETKKCIITFHDVPYRIYKNLKTAYNSGEDPFILLNLLSAEDFVKSQTGNNSLDVALTKGSKVLLGNGAASLEVQDNNIAKITFY